MLHTVPYLQTIPNSLEPLMLVSDHATSILLTTARTSRWYAEMILGPDLM